MKIISFIFTFFLLLSFPLSAFAQQPQPSSITPTLFCLGSCPGNSVSPTQTNTTPSTNPVTSGPSGSVSTIPSTTQISSSPPCTSVSIASVHTFKVHKKPSGAISQLINLLLQFLIQLIEQLLGMHLQQPTTGTPQPTAAPVNPLPSGSAPSGPAPSLNPCTTQAPQPTAAPQPTQTQPTQGTQPTQTQPTQAAQTTPPASSVMPDGPTGSWKLVWSDEFNGTSIDTSKWYVFDNVGRQGITTHASNVSESGGDLHITLASGSSGAEVNSWNTQGAGKPTNGFGLAYGDAVEARIWIPGSGSTTPDWPSFWTSGHTVPGDFSGGEIDIFEGLSGQLHIDYNNTTAHVVGPVPSGSWLGSWHTYTAVRHGPASAATYDVYWDGKLVWHTGPYAESGNALQGILLTEGNSSQYGGPLQAPVTMLVDWVRAWAPN